MRNSKQSKRIPVLVAQIKAENNSFELKKTNYTYIVFSLSG